jgi:hypothetical protein
MSSAAVPQDIRNRSAAGIARPKSSMVGKVLSQYFLEGQATLLRESPAPSLPQHISQGSPLRIPVRS